MSDQSFENAYKTIENLNKYKTKRVNIPLLPNYAYIEGNIINTNECLLHLGDDYYLNTVNSKALVFIKNRFESRKEVSKLKESKATKETKEDNKLVSLTKLNDETYEIKEEYCCVEEDERKVKGDEKYRKSNDENSISVKKRLLNRLNQKEVDDVMTTMINKSKNNDNQSNLSKEFDLKNVNKKESEKKKKKDIVQADNIKFNN